MILVLVQLVHALLLWILPFHPYPELFIYPYLTDQGFLPYQNILDQHFPGLMFFPINLFTLGFRDPGSLKILMLLVVLAQSSLIYFIVKRLANKPVALLSCVLFAIWQPFFEGSQLWINSLLPLLTLPGFWYFSQKRWATTGFFMGLAIIFKQTLVPLALALSVVIIVGQKVKRLSSFLRYALVGVVPPALMLAYFLSIGVLSDFWYWTVTFNLTTYAQDGTVAPTVGQLLRLILPVGLVLASLFVKQFRELARMSALFAALSILGGIGRFEFLHFLPAVSFLAICAGILTFNLWSDKKVGAIWFLVGLTAVWLGHFYYRQTGYLTTRYFEQSTFDTMEIIKARTDPGDKIFLLGLNPHLYSLTGTLPPGKIFVFQFPWFLKIAESRVLKGLEQDPPKLIVFDREAGVDGLYLRDYAKTLVRYTMDNYSPFFTMGTSTFYERRN